MWPVCFTDELPADSVLQPFREYYTQAECSLHSILQIRFVFIFTSRTELEFMNVICDVTYPLLRFMDAPSTTLLLKWTGGWCNDLLGLKNVFLSGENGICLWFQQIILMVPLFLIAGSCQTLRRIRPGLLLYKPLTMRETPSDSLSTFTRTVKSSYGQSSIRTFNWTDVLLPVYKRWGRIDLLSDSTMPSLAGYLTFLWLAKQAINKLASG